MYKLFLGDCLEILKKLDQKADMILCDLPYGTTQCKWDSCINLDEMWPLVWSSLKDNGAAVFTAQTPFDKVLGCSQLKYLKYEWIWEKTAATGFLNAKKAPMKAHENILVFYKKQPTYNPQKTLDHKPSNSYTKRSNKLDGDCYGKTVSVSGGGDTSRYPRSVQIFKSDKQKSSLHPTQKPVALMEYLINTYTNLGDTVLDFTMGSGTTGVAAINSGRNFIGVEKDDNYYNIAKNRIESLLNQGEQIEL